MDSAAQIRANRLFPSQFASYVPSSGRIGQPSRPFPIDSRLAAKGRRPDFANDCLHPRHIVCGQMRCGSGASVAAFNPLAPVAASRHYFPHNSITFVTSVDPAWSTVRVPVP